MDEEFLYELISAYVDGEVTEDERLRVQTLLSARADLRQYHDELLMMGEGVQGLPQLRLPSAFRDKVWAEISRQSLDSVSATAETTVVRVPATSFPKATNTTESANRGDRIRWSTALIAIGSIAALFLIAFNLGWLDQLRDHSADPIELAWNDGSQPVSESSSTSVDPQRPDEQADQSTSESDATARNAELASVDPIESRDASSTQSRMAEDDHSNRREADDARTDQPNAATAAAVPGSPDETPEEADTSLPGIMLVLDVVLSSRGIAEDVFGVALERAEIPWMNHIAMDAGMEDSLLGSRFFGGVRADQLPLEPTPGTRPEDDDHLRLAFVVARGEQIVETIDQLAMARGTGEVVALRFDIAMGGNESELAVQLHRVLRDAKGPRAEPVRAHPLTIEASTQQRLLVALRRMNGTNASAALDPSENSSEGGSADPPSGTDPRFTASNWKMLEGPSKFPVLFVFRSEERVRLDAPRPD